MRLRPATVRAASPPRRINEIVHGARAVSVDTALRLARYFGTSERFWLNLQAQHDLDVDQDRVGDRIERGSRHGRSVPPPGEEHVLGSSVHPEPRRRAQSP